MISCMTPFAIKNADSQIRLLESGTDCRTQLDTWHTKGPLAALRRHEFGTSEVPSEAETKT